LLTLRQATRARELFQKAVELDPNNARAWSGLSSAWSSQTTAAAVPYAQGYEQAESAARHALVLDTMDGTAWVNLGFLRGIQYRSLSTGLTLIQKGVERDPGNAEVFLVEASLYRSAWRWDDAKKAMRFAEQLDPITPFYLRQEAINDACAGDFDAARQLFETGITRVASDTSMHNGRARALAALGRFDEAIAAWKESATVSGDVLLADKLSHARGRAGYWEVRHLDGQQRLQQLKQPGRAWTSPRAIMQAEFAAGDFDAAYRDLETLAAPDAENPLYRLPCISDFDEVRSTPRFVAIQKRVGALPP
jgi:tetratricopeptide (TPR) repeat protein